MANTYHIRAGGSDAASGLSDTENRVRLLRSDRIFQNYTASDKLSWDLKFT